MASRRRHISLSSYGARQKTQKHTHTYTRTHKHTHTHTHTHTHAHRPGPSSRTTSSNNSSDYVYRGRPPPEKPASPERIGSPERFAPLEKNEEMPGPAIVKSVSLNLSKPAYERQFSIDSIPEEDPAVGFGHYVGPLPICKAPTGSMTSVEESPGSVRSQEYKPPVPSSAPTLGRRDRPRLSSKRSLAFKTSHASLSQTALAACAANGVRLATVCTMELGVPLCSFGGDSNNGSATDSRADSQITSQSTSQSNNVSNVKSSKEKQWLLLAEKLVAVSERSEEDMVREGIALTYAQNEEIPRSSRTLVPHAETSNLKRNDIAAALQFDLARKRTMVIADAAPAQPSSALIQPQALNITVKTDFPKRLSVSTSHSSPTHFNGSKSGSPLSLNPPPTPNFSTAPPNTPPSAAHHLPSPLRFGPRPLLWSAPLVPVPPPPSSEISAPGGRIEILQQRRATPPTEAPPQLAATRHRRVSRDQHQISVAKLYPEISGEAMRSSATLLAYAAIPRESQIG
jgi:hypothetical protein